MATFKVHLTAGSVTETLTVKTPAQAQLMVFAFNTGLKAAHNGQSVQLDIQALKARGVQKFHYIMANASWLVIKEDLKMATMTKTEARQQFKRIWADQCRMHTAMRDSDLAKNYSWENFKRALLRDGKINREQFTKWELA